MTYFASFTAEAKARNRELLRRGLPPERPGALPGEKNGGNGGSLSEEVMEERIFAALSDGPKSRTEIREACGSSGRIIQQLDAMVERGDLRSWQVRYTKYYEAAE